MTENIVLVQEKAGKSTGSYMEYRGRCLRHETEGFVFVDGSGPSWNDGWYDQVNRIVRYWSYWLAPASGFEGLRRWAYHMGALRAEKAPSEGAIRIITQEGQARHFVGRGGESIGAVCAHCGVTGAVVVVEARRVEGVRCLPCDIYGIPGIRAIFSRCWWFLDEDVIFVREEPWMTEVANAIVRYSISGYATADQQAHLPGLKVPWLYAAEIAALAAGHDPKPRHDRSGAVWMTAEEIRRDWTAILQLPGYETAVRALQG